jgi:hypothetical protein
MTRDFMDIISTPSVSSPASRGRYPTCGTKGIISKFKISKISMKSLREIRTAL